MSTTYDTDFELVRIRFKKLYRKAKELDLRDGDIRKLEVIQKHQDYNFNIITLIFRYVFYAVVLLCLLAGAVFGCVKLNLITARTVAEWSTVITKVDLNTDQCVLSFHENVLDLVRPPVNCSFCKGINSFTRVSNLSQKEFIDKYAYSGHPVIITDATKNWTAFETFTFDFLKSVYKDDSPVFAESGGSGCQFFPYKTSFHSLKDVFKMSEKMKQMKGAPWYIGWSNCDPSAANILRQHYTRPYFLSREMESSRTDWMFMGTPGYGAHIHIDSVQHSSWQAQIKGDKEWTLEPPPECYYECPGRFQDTVKAGEVIVLDTNRWFHGTNVVGDQLSIVIGSEYD